MEGPTHGAANKTELYIMPKPLEDKLKEEEARKREERRARAAAELVKIRVKDLG